MFRSNPLRSLFQVAPLPDRVPPSLRSAGAKPLGHASLRSVEGSKTYKGHASLRSAKPARYAGLEVQKHKHIVSREYMY